ncbi:MAG: GTP-binding protein [Candidatus Hodarchaeota archaeon]
MPKTIYKIVLCGEGAVGKTALRDRFMGKPFSEDYMMTIGADVAFKTAIVSGKEIQFQVWDLAGQPRFEIVQPPYYRGSLGGLLVFDVSRPVTLEKAQNWAERLWAFSGKGKVPVVLLGNKVDLRKSLDMTLTVDQGQKVAEELSKSCQQAGFDVPYVETSAMTGKNVEDAFMLLAQNISDYIKAQLAS